jgi:hypothetical protein
MFEMTENGGLAGFTLPWKSARWLIVFGRGAALCPEGFAFFDLLGVLLRRFLCEEPCSYAKLFSSLILDPNRIIHCINP